MEQMKVSSIVKAYPNAFVLCNAAKRDNSGRVSLANILGVYEMKSEVKIQQEIWELMNVKTFVVPTFDDADEGISITISGDDYKAEPLITPAESAKMFRDYWVA